MPGTKRKGKGDAWYFEVTIGSDFTGKPIRYNKTFHGTAKQADKALAAFYTECDKGTVNRSQSLTVKDLASLFISEHVNKQLKESSRQGVISAINTHILPDLGTRKVGKLKRLDIQQWINSLTEQETLNKNGEPAGKTLSPKTIRNCYSVLSKMCTFAVEMDLLEQSPCHDVKLPTPDKKEATYYSREEVSRLLDFLEALPSGDLRYKVAIYLALFGGLRKGEIMGLNWSDYDPKTHTIKIERARMVAKGGGVYTDTPKTEKSRRSVALPAFVCSSMDKLKTQQKTQKLALGCKFHDSPAMIQNDFGEPLYPHLLDRWLSRFIEDNYLPHITLHGLRHTHTSLLAYMNTDKMEISKRLGHSQLSTTLNIYTHLFEDTDKQIADDLEIFTENLRNEEIKNG